MTNPVASGVAGCQQSKVSIIYHVLKDIDFCSHAETCVKRILIPPACGLAEAAPALPSAEAELGAGASQYDSMCCQDLALQEWPEPPRSVACLHWVLRAGCEPPRRSGQGQGLRGRHRLSPSLMKSWFPHRKQRAGGTPAPTTAQAQHTRDHILSRSHAWDSPGSGCSASPVAVGRAVCKSSRGEFAFYKQSVRVCK